MSAMALGNLPEGWEVRHLGQIGDAIIGLTYSPEDVAEEGVLVLRSSNIQDGRLSFDDNVYVTALIPERVVTRENDLLICVRNGSKRLIGKCALIDGRTAGEAFGAFMSVFRSPLNRYIIHAFQSDIISRQIRSTLGATINQITNRDLLEFALPLPRLESEQRAIAASLSDVDALLQSLDRLIAKKRGVKQGAMQQLLTGTIRLPGFGGVWETKQLGELGAFFKGSGIKKDEVRSEGLACVRYGEIYTSFENWVSKSRSFIAETTAWQATAINVGDILFAASGETAEEIGKCVAYLGAEPAFAGGDIVVLRPSESCDSLYLGYLLNTSEIASQKSRLGQGHPVAHIGASALGRVIVSLPLLPEQRAIAAVLSDMDAEIDTLVARRNKVAAIKQGMMQELLTGRTRLPIPKETNDG
jgi:type I restriction enzyme, S subunit